MLTAAEAVWKLPPRRTPRGAEQPVTATSTRYAGALGARIEWNLKTTATGEPAKA